MRTLSGREEQEVPGTGLGSQGHGGACTEEGAWPQHRHNSRNAKDQLPHPAPHGLHSHSGFGQENKNSVDFAGDGLRLSGRAILNAKFKRIVSPHFTILHFSGEGKCI